MSIEDSVSEGWQTGGAGSIRVLFLPAGLGRDGPTAADDRTSMEQSVSDVWLTGGAGSIRVLFLPTGLGRTGMLISNSESHGYLSTSIDSMVG